MDFKILIKKALFFIYNHINYKNRIYVNGSNHFNYKLSKLNGLKIKIKGENNYIIINDGCQLIDCNINILCDNNTVILEKSGYYNQVEFYLEDNGNSISVGQASLLCGKTHLACIEGKSITIGENCMFSSNITFRVGDSHSIVNSNNERINHSKDIIVSNHVWIGADCTLLKGCEIAESCVIATGAVVTGKFPNPNCIIGGVPSKVIKTGINWLARRI